MTKEIKSKVIIVSAGPVAEKHRSVADVKIGSYFKFADGWPHDCQSGLMCMTWHDKDKDAYLFNLVEDPSRTWSSGIDWDRSMKDRHVIICDVHVTYRERSEYAG